MVHRHNDIKLLNFLHSELELPKADIAIALRQRELEN